MRCVGAKVLSVRQYAASHRGPSDPISCPKIRFHCLAVQPSFLTPGAASRPYEWLRAVVQTPNAEYRLESAAALRSPRCWELFFSGRSRARVPELSNQSVKVSRDSF